MPNIGFSFQPGSQSIGVGQPGQSQQSGPQSAVEIKSFQLPNRFVPGQIAPQALLQSPGGGGQLDVEILKRLMQVFAPQGQQPGVPTLNPPTFGTQPVRTPQEPQLPTDTTSGWRANEGGLNPQGAPAAVPSNGAPYDAGTGYNPMPQAQVPLSNSEPPTPRIIPGQLAPDPGTQEPGLTDTTQGWRANERNLNGFTFPEYGTGSAPVANKFDAGQGLFDNLQSFY